jgi:anti-sigma-K factor RskA
LNALAGAYALDALDEDERTIFEEHLKSCADCVEEVRGMRSTAAELSHAVATTPPPELRASVLGAISQVRPWPPIVDNVLPIRRSRTSRIFWPAIAAACALIAVVSAGWGFQQHRDATRKQVASATCSVLGARDATATNGVVGSGQATLVYSKSAHCMALLARGIPQPASGKTYQLWAITADGNAMSAGLFAPDANGDVVLNGPGDLSTATRMGISVEPTGGSAKPTPGAIIATMAI